jgi:RIO kinase 1
VIDTITCPLKSGKEADVFIVEREDACYIAKVFRERQIRSFKNDAGYREGRKSGNTRSQRAMDNNSRYGKELAEAAWHKAEANALTELFEAGVRVPELFDHFDQVLFMELICDDDGEPAPQLGNVKLTAEQALDTYETVLGEIIRMLLAGYIHADLSPYNVLLDDDGPVIIDFPQCISAAHNLQAGKILERDIHSISQHLGLINPKIRELGKEAWQIWEEYKNGSLTADFRPRPGRKRALPTADLPNLMDYLRETEREVELAKLAKEGDLDAWRELSTADKHAEMRARGIEPVIEEVEDDEDEENDEDIFAYEDFADDKLPASRIAGRSSRDTKDHPEDTLDDKYEFEFEDEYDDDDEHVDDDEYDRRFQSVDSGADLEDEEDKKFAGDFGDDHKEDVFDDDEDLEDEEFARGFGLDDEEPDDEESARDFGRDAEERDVEERDVEERDVEERDVEERDVEERDVEELAERIPAKKVSVDIPNFGFSRQTKKSKNQRPLPRFGQRNKSKSRSRHRRR